MAKILYLWDKDKTRSVVASKLRELDIHRRPDGTAWQVRGWFNQKESFIFGQFDTSDEARVFVDNLHLMMADS